MKKGMSAIHYNYNRFTDKSYFSKTRKYCPRVLSGLSFCGPLFH